MTYADVSLSLCGVSIGYPGSNRDAKVPRSLDRMRRTVERREAIADNSGMPNLKKSSDPRKLVVWPAVDAARLAAIVEAAAPMAVVNCEALSDAMTEIADADAFFGKMTPELLEAARRLRWVQSPTASLEHYLFPELIAHPCQLSNMRGLFSDVIAEHVFAYILCITRNLHVYLRQQRTPRWEPVGGEESRHAFAAGPGTVTSADRAHRQLADCSLGVIGVGEIGAEICRRGASFGMTVYGVDPKARSIPGVLNEVWPSQRLDDLLSQSDFVVVAAPHTPETEKLFRLRRFRAMRQNAWLINIGRGAIVDLQDLTTALDQKLIAGAALDVFETEPLPPDHPLWSRDNVIITPHVAGMSPHIAERHLETLLENCRRFVRGEDPMTLVDKSRWY